MEAQRLVSHIVQYNLYSCSNKVIQLVLNLRLFHCYPVLRGRKRFSIVETQLCRWPRQHFQCYALLGQLVAHVLSGVLWSS